MWENIQETKSKTNKQKNKSPLKPFYVSHQICSWQRKWSYGRVASCIGIIQVRISRGLRLAVEVHNWARIVYGAQLSGGQLQLLTYFC